MFILILEGGVEVSQVGTRVKEKCSAQRETIS